MLKQAFRFRLIDILLLMALFPVAIGFAAECYGETTYLEIIVFGDPLANLSRAVAALTANSSGILPRLFYECLLTMIRVVPCWFVIVVMMSSFALLRSRIARCFSLMLILSVPAMEWLFGTSSLELTNYSLSLVIAEIGTISYFVAVSIFILIKICKVRPILDRPIAAKSARFFSWQRIFFIIGAIATILISATGWNALSH